MSNRMQDRMPDKMSENNQLECENIFQIKCQNICRNICQIESQNMFADRMSDRRAEYMWDKMSDSMPECMSDKISDRMSGYLLLLGSHEVICLVFFVVVRWLCQSFFVNCPRSVLAWTSTGMLPFHRPVGTEICAQGDDLGDGCSYLYCKQLIWINLFSTRATETLHGYIYSWIGGTKQFFDFGGPSYSCNHQNNIATCLWKDWRLFMALGFPYYSTMNSLGLVCFLWGISTFQSNKTGLRRSPRRFAVISTYFDNWPYFDGGQVPSMLVYISWNRSKFVLRSDLGSINLIFIAQSSEKCQESKPTFKHWTCLLVLDWKYGSKTSDFLSQTATTTLPRKTWFTLGYPPVN